MSSLILELEHSHRAKGEKLLSGMHGFALLRVAHTNCFVRVLRKTGGCKDRCFITAQITSSQIR
jgi:hypothetical protein